MASSFQVKVGPLTGTAAFKGTDAQFQSGLEDLMILEELDTSGTNQEKMNRIAEFMMRDYMGRVKIYRRRKAEAEQRAALEAQLDADLPI